MAFNAGYVGLIGLPNSGKSTLVNALIGEKVGIVSSKPQTTRQRVLGILNNEDMQAVVIDPPGFVQSESGLNHFLQSEFEDCFDDCDVLVLVLNLDAKNPEKFDQLIHMVSQSNKPWMVIISKCDLPQFHRIAILKEKLRDYDVPVIQVSAKKRSEELKEKWLPLIIDRLPESPGPFFDPDIYTTQSSRELVGEIIREKAFENLHQEIPFGLAVQIRKYDESRQGLIKIYSDLVVSKANHRQIVVGQKAQLIRKIGTQARLELEKILQSKIYLDLHVKVKEHWTKNKSQLKELGYESATQ